MVAILSAPDSPPVTDTETSGKKDYHDLQRTIAQIVAAFVTHNHVPVSELPELIKKTGEALRALIKVEDTKVSLEHMSTQIPAVSIRSSVTNDALICLEDGRSFKSLRRHLKTYFNLTPDEYRKKWGLPADYPMVAPSYRARRSQLAKDSGLGRGRSNKRSP